MTTSPDSKPETVIEISELTKDYQVGFVRKRTIRALDALSLEVYRGEIFGFLGPNGAGKTTTLKLLMRLIYPTAGTAKVLGRPIDDVAMRARIGYLPENPYFYDYLSGRELLRYTGALFGLSKQAAQTRADELLSHVGLEAERADRQLRKYSKGMLQRIGIAQALVNDPEVIFFDEPMSGLDPIGRREVRDLILELRRQRKTIFFSSHILSDVEALCDRAAILNRGRLLRVGTVEELTSTGDSAMEVIATGISRESIKGLLGEVQSVEASETPGGLHLLVKNANEIEQAIALVLRAGGHLISVNPRRASLEDLFADKNGASSD